MDALSISWDQLFTNELGLFAFVTGILSVLLLLPTKLPRLQYFNWIAGVATSAAYFVLYREWQLYGSMALQVYFVVLSLMGAWVWRGQLIHRFGYNPNSFLSRFVGSDSLPTTNTTPKEFGLSVLAGFALVVPVFLVLTNFQDAAPLADAFVLAFSAIALFWQVRKKVQNWWLWIFVDLISIPLYLYRANGATALLYVLYLAMCIVGLIAWRKQAREDELTAIAVTVEGDMVQTDEGLIPVRDVHLKLGTS